MAQPKHEIEVVAAETSASLVGEVEPHWTAKAMADARSIEPEVPEEAIIALMSPKTWVQEGNPTVMESVPPDGAIVGDDEDITDLRDGIKTTRVPTANYDNIPYCAVGKLFMTFNGGLRGQCMGYLKVVFLQLRLTIQCWRHYESSEQQILDR